ncbi:Heat shock protein tDnaJ [Gracilaria domingensis]|nr:Heat shock protein tDnaJ [Gracilaria domingensis]
MTDPSEGIGEDLYTILKVSRDANETDLRSSFRKLSQQFHPDKHLGEQAKATATDHFTKVKEAYEILSNSKFRRIYNEFGLDAARAAAMPGMELVPYNDLAERFRNESMGGNGGAGISTPRDAYFTVTNSLEPRIDATGLSVALEDGDYINAKNLAVCTQVGIATVATAYVSQNNTVIARYAAACQGSRYQSRASGGAGEVAVSIRRQIDPHMQAEVTAHVPLEESQSITYGLKTFRSLSQNMTGAFDVTYDPGRNDLTTALTYTRSFNERCTASASWAYGAASGYAFSWRRNAFDEYISDSVAEKDAETELFGPESSECQETSGSPWRRRIAVFLKKLNCFIEPMGVRWTARWSLMDASISCLLRRPIGLHAPLFEKCEPTGPGGGFVRARGSLGVMGWEMELGGGRKYVLADTAWTMSVAFGTLGVVWRLKMTRSGHRFSLPVVLHSATADPKTATIAAITTSALVSAIQYLIVEPWQQKKDQSEREEAKSRRADVLSQGRQDAGAALEMMKQTIERIRKEEEAVEIDGKKGSGLIIKKAVYGVTSSVTKMRFTDDALKNREIEAEAADVTDAVQCLVAKSALQVVSATKSTLPGFWDPSAYGDKDDIVLKVWYLFKTEKHECIIGDDQAIELPLSSHRVSEWS